MTKTFVASCALLVTIALAVAPVAAQAPAPHATKPAPAAAVQPPAPAASVPTMTSVVPSDYVIGPDDLLQVSVWKNETLSRAMPVRPDGKISLPLLHDVQAAGLTAMQLRDKIATALAEFMPNPEVSVIVTEVRSQRVSVLGEVQKPGVIQLHGNNMSILEAIAMAGGFGTFASPTKIMVIRKDPAGQTQKIRFNYNKAISDPSEQVLTLKNGDVIVVP